MVMPRITMRKIKEILRLRLDHKLSQEEIGRSVRCGRSSVGECLARFKGSNLTWPLPDISDLQLEELLYPPPASSKVARKEPDWSYVAQEMRRKHVTLQLLWGEYRAGDKNCLGYTQFCSHYRQWRKNLDMPFRNNHKAGEKVFVDYAGQTIPIQDPLTGEVRRAQIFVGVLGASNYTFVEATWSQSLPDWIGSHKRMLNFFGGVPKVIVPDNLKSGVKSPCRYDPEINPTYHAFAKHYDTSIIPARSYKPKDKAKAEGGVLIAGRWIFAAIRNHTFFSLDELNAEIGRRLLQLNSKPFKKLPGNRASSFATIDQPCLRGLPVRPFEINEIILGKVNIDYHMEVSRHYYSVPYQLIGKRLEARLTTSVIEVFHNNKRVASHKRSEKLGGYTTVTEHMPPKHKAHVKWTPDRMVHWVGQAGPSTARLAQIILKSREHPEQNFRRILGMIRLGKKYGQDRLESACFRALRYETTNYRSLKNILQSGLDKVATTEPPVEEVPIEHTNIRGPDYFT